jgi:putative flippase GtrA
MISEKISHLFAKHRNIVLYFFIGVSAAVVDYGIFLVCFNIFDIPSVLSTALSIGTATLYGFLLNMKYNFKTDDRVVLRFVSYSTVSGIGMLFSVAFLYVFNVRLGYDGNVMKLLSLPFIFVIQYSINKAVTFRKSVQ